MCGRRRVVNTLSKASPEVSLLGTSIGVDCDRIGVWLMRMLEAGLSSVTVEKPPAQFSLAQVEILVSDSELSGGGAANKSGASGDCEDDHDDHDHDHDGDGNDDSDFEEVSSGRNRKRTKVVVGKDKPPAEEKQKRVPADSPSSNGVGRASRKEEVAPSDGAVEAEDGDSSARKGADRSFSTLGEREAVTGGGSSAAIVSASSFGLQENAKRRSAFQAGLRAALGDDGAPAVAAGGGGDNAGDASSGCVGVNAKEGVAGEGAESAEPHSKTSSSSSSSSSRNKGKGGATAGRVKLTPMEQQVVDLKEKHPGVLLLVECGYRYRFFGEDALAAAKVRFHFPWCEQSGFCVPAQPAAGESTPYSTAHTWTCLHTCCTAHVSYHLLLQQNDSHHS